MNDFLLYFSCTKFSASRFEFSCQSVALESSITCARSVHVLDMHFKKQKGQGGSGGGGEGSRVLATCTSKDRLLIFTFTNLGINNSHLCAGRNSGSLHNGVSISMVCDRHKCPLEVCITGSVPFLLLYVKILEP
jgi:hypothetical protein